jgi:hypothetical protein
MYSSSDFDSSAVGIAFSKYLSQCSCPFHVVVLGSADCETSGLQRVPFAHFKQGLITLSHKLKFVVVSHVLEKLGRKVCP